MFRSLHMKLVLIMLLLITSLMAVVGAFLMTSVTNFYIDNFYSQMGETFGESNADFVNSLRAEAAQEGGVAVMQSMLETYSGTLGIDSRSRNHYIPRRERRARRRKARADRESPHRPQRTGRRRERHRGRLHGRCHPHLRRRQQLYHLHP